MPIKFDCPWCSHTHSARLGGGVTAPCPKCGVQITHRQMANSQRERARPALWPCWRIADGGKTQSAPRPSPLPSSAPTQYPMTHAAQASTADHTAPLPLHRVPGGHRSHRTHHDGDHPGAHDGCVWLVVKDRPGNITLADS